MAMPREKGDKCYAALESLYTPAELELRAREIIAAADDRAARGDGDSPTGETPPATDTPTSRRRHKKARRRRTRSSPAPSAVSESDPSNATSMAELPPDFSNVKPVSECASHAPTARPSQTQTTLGSVVSDKRRG
jgi:hypothetical protein